MPETAAQTTVSPAADPAAVTTSSQAAPGVKPDVNPGVAAPLPINPNIPLAAREINTLAVPEITEILPDKKWHPGPLFYLSIGAIVSLACLVGSVWGFHTYWHGRPDHVLADVLHTLATADHATITTTITAKIPDPDTHLGITAVSARMQDQLSLPSMSGTHNYTLARTDADYPVSIVKTINRDGIISFQVSGLDELLDAASDELTAHPETTPVLAALDPDLVAMIEDEHWQADFPALAKQLHTQYPDFVDPTATSQIDTYACLQQHLTHFDRSTLVHLYERYPFLSLVKTTTSHHTPAPDAQIYTLHIDPEILTAYANKLFPTTAYQQLQNCLTGNKHYRLPGYLATEEVQDWVASLPDIYLEVTTADHTLTRIYLDGNHTTTPFTAELELTFPATSPVVTLAQTAPLATIATAYYGNQAAEASAAAAAEKNRLAASSLELDDYLAATTPEIRNNDRVYDINIVANALEACHNAATGTYTAANVQGWADVYDAQTLSGAYARSINTCLTSDIIPALPDYPYSYDLIATVRGQQTAGYAVCATLEPTAGWEYLATSSVIIDTSMYHVNGTWDAAPACTSDSTACYYCRFSGR